MIGRAGRKGIDTKGRTVRHHNSPYFNPRNVPFLFLGENQLTKIETEWLLKFISKKHSPTNYVC